MLRLHLDWTNVGAVTATSTLHFAGFNNDDAESAASRTELWWADIKEYFSTSTSLRVRPQVEVIDEGTGEITDVREVITTAAAGTNVSLPVAQAAQVLFRLETGVRYRSRLIKGRIYLPGFGTNSSGGGEVGSAARANITDSYSILRGSGLTPPVVWTRPREVLGTPAIPGFSTPALAASVWNEFAVLRSRRS